MKKLQNSLFVALLLLGIVLIMGCNQKEGPIAPESALNEATKPLLKSSCNDCISVPSGIISWWPFDEISGTTAEDIADANNGTIIGATPISGKVDGAFNFDGVDDYVSVPDDPSLDITYALTIDAWIKPDRLIGEQAIVNKQPSGWADENHAGNYEFGLWDAKLVFKSQFAPYNRTEGNIADMDDLIADQWYFVAVTADASSRTVKYYVNSNMVDVIVWRNSLLQYPNDEALLIGRRNDGLFFKGIIDEVEIYDRALTDSEIQAIFNAGSAGKCKIIDVEIDIKPGSEPNSINCKNNNGVIPVAILTTSDFDAITVDHTTVHFGKNGTEAMEVHMDKKSGEPKRHEEDVDSDGDIDLVFHFRFGDTGIECGDEEAILTGETYYGQKIKGIDTIRTVGH